MEQLAHLEVPAKLKMVSLFMSGTFFLLVLRALFNALYNVYLHPLSKYPGPKLATATNVVFSYMCLIGEQVSWTRRMHEKYGEVVRLSPDRLSYISAQAWKDIAGHRIGGRKENTKDPVFYFPDSSEGYSLINTEGVHEHSRIRKIFSNAFSDKALKLQEPLIKKYVDLLVDLIRQSVSAKADVNLDLVKLYNCTTFDIMGDLAFGEPLGMLETSEYTPWVKAVFGSIKAGTFYRLMRQYPFIARIAKWFVPRSIRKLEKMHYQHSADRVDRRLEKGTDIDKPDIWSLVLDKGPNQLSRNQMLTNSSLFMVAGTETTATLLSGLTFFLLKNPETLKKVVQEVRALSETQLSLEMLPRLPYLNACFEEGLRLYPPVPTGLPRVVATGGNAICGEWVPANTRVFVSQDAAYRSPHNFKDPDSFIPERWLPNTGYDTDNKDVLLPFSVGPRNCLGKNLAYHEMRIILATLLWHFDLELCPESSSWVDQKVWTLWSKPELWVMASPIR
ncbi:cytochrome P450 [Melanomma pulvis-pyrius CBS 109.77]|uniref:Cytochrome P450 n=1 Tax=Melanomma pulvis-pyrius CBS 109.77 TaxID=1314802 RepID=A0A6A6X5Y1_9PLEO|nr:cytochrome P450 [Melanomma pulvis-pyrius CBS 109.77]